MSRPRLPSTVLKSVILALATTVIVAGCGSDDNDSPAASDDSAGCASATTTGRTDVNLISIPPAKVAVTDYGTGVRRVPALTPDLSTPQRVTLVTTSTVASSPTDRQSEAIETPFTARFACTDRSDLELVTGTPTSPDATLNDQLGGANGTQAGMAMAPGAAPISLRLIPPESAGEEARLALEQSLTGALTRWVPLPTEAVGVGATWRAQRVVYASATVTQTIEATLTAWTGNRLTITYTADETPVNSVFAVPGSADTLTIARYSFTGSGTVTVDLTRGLPVGGAATFRGARELVGADPARPLVQQTGFTTTWR
ncbi:hypothetical protein QSJ18_11775 [Gordonia sp. ABSL1-1]|uniref:hypothetical protein n=1 Tax=Gordonia sp. ABSL1-1 TaxID=3053923 RepID=UPI002574493C|nr:hypothetical protein [Gordonia sp. ABSL1-1]MDL9937425.1 hypothetical protein [Gordonia sp. ABSL1-1]